MGLAASQARFLGLTARKSNVEYEGQQVNQQRTALANESASLYSQLTNLKVPTPPDVTNYYRTEYSFKYNDQTYTMSTLPSKDDDGTYSLKVSYTETIPSYTTLASDDGIDFSGASDSTLKDLKYLKEYINKNREKEGQTLLGDDTPVKGVIVSNDKRYYKVDNKTYQYHANEVEQPHTYNKVLLKYNQSGDFESIKIPDLTGDNYISVSTTNVQDSNAYDLAMNEYQKEYAQYEKTMAAINAKTETIQQQDKTLELRLNQLDTEQNAIATEMDAVTKVIEKNVQSTFKTFA